MVWLKRQIGITVEQLLFLIFGGLFAYWLNLAVAPYSTTFYWVVLVLGFPLLLILASFFDEFREISKYVKGRITLLGASFVSLMLASFTFFNYVSVLYSHGVNLTPFILANIFKSILLASVFSFSERLIKFFEDQKERNLKSARQIEDKLEVKKWA
jgi:hypothetical protein